MTNSMLTSGLFGSLFQDRETAKEFSANAFLNRALVFERCWTDALCADGGIAAKDADSARQAIDKFDVQGFVANSDEDGLPIPSLIKELRANVSETAAQAIHTGLTSQDVIDTVVVLTHLTILDRFDQQLSDLLTKLDHLDDQFGKAPLMARTRMQAALSATVSDRIGIWKSVVTTQKNSLSVLLDEVSKVQIGGPIGLRDTPKRNFETMAGHAAAALELQLTDVWHTDRSAMVGLGHWYTRVTGATAKIGQDISLMAQQGVDEIKLSDGGSSSAMPHKQNPIKAEALISLGRYVAGLQSTLAQSMIHEQERSGSAWALEWITLPAMAEATGGALRVTNELLGSITRLGDAP